MRTCYMCDRIATSDEHAPPQCLFPEKRNAGEKDYRINLITVPSCDEHNHKKSAEDGFLMAYLAGLAGNNGVGLLHSCTKGVRASLKKTDVSLLQTLFRTQGKKISSTPAVTKLFKAIAYKVNSLFEARLLDCFEHIARALYFHETRQRFSGAIRVHFTHADFRHPLDPDKARTKAFIDTLAAQEFSEQVGKGHNPDVFHYQFTPKSSNGFILLKMVFYGNSPVYAAMQPEGVSLPNSLEICLPIEGELVTFLAQGANYVVEVTPHPFSTAPLYDGEADTCE